MTERNTVYNIIKAIVFFWEVFWVTYNRRNELYSFRELILRGKKITRIVPK